MIIGLNCVELDWEGSEEGRSPKQEEGQIKDNLHMSSGFGERVWMVCLVQDNNHYLKAEYEQATKQTGFSGKSCLGSREMENQDT